MQIHFPDRQLIREMAAENPPGEDRIAHKLQLKLTILVSPRTVGKYLREGRPVHTPGPETAPADLPP
jgi:hypothetical protein